MGCYLIPSASKLRMCRTYTKSITITRTCILRDICFRLSNLRVFDAFVSNMENLVNFQINNKWTLYFHYMGTLLFSNADQVS